MNTRACLVLLMVVIVLAPLSMSKPSAFEKDNSGKDLKDLESMLSGEHRGADYAQGALPNQQSFVGAFYDLPYKNVFLNDTFFGDFLREFNAGPSISSLNLTEPESPLIGLSHQNNSTIAKPAGTSHHNIKSILVKEPDF